MSDPNEIAVGDPGATSFDVYDSRHIPDFATQFIHQSEINAFARALHAPETVPVTALNDWAPVNQRVRRLGRSSKRRRGPVRTKDETREGFVYSLLKWPLLFIVVGWLLVLCISYLLTRFYIWSYEQSVTWRGKRQILRNRLRSCSSYEEWRKEASKLDEHLRNDEWKSSDAYAYYDDTTIRRVTEQLQNLRKKATSQAKVGGAVSTNYCIQDLRHLVEACSKSNFAGIESPRLYSETYFGTKNLAQKFINELELSISFLLGSKCFNDCEKHVFSEHLYRNLGRTALCLSGGAGFAYYHFGVAKALLDANLLPEVITGTSGGALVAALLGTRTDNELKQLLVPALANKITACEESITVWLKRWWRTGARFDSLDWAKKCSWFCRGSTTFREAYERTGRILNITCIPSDPHSPAILANYITAPNAVIWSTVLASAAVPGILNPVVLMMKTRHGSLAPYSFGHKWKDGSLRTDIPLKALNLHFNVNFSIVSQVNPHINLFFFSSRGTVGRPVTHRKGRGWRGGFLGSAVEQYLKLDLTKWLKVLRHLELLPRWMGQDWSEIFLQQFSGTVTIWPQSRVSDFYHILSDPSPQRLSRMIHAGQLSTFPKLLFIENRMKIERLIMQGLTLGRNGYADMGNIRQKDTRTASTSGKELGGQKVATSRADAIESRRRDSTILEELKRQSGVLFGNMPVDGYDTDMSSTNSDIGKEVSDKEEAPALTEIHRTRSA